MRHETSILMYLGTTMGGEYGTQRRWLVNLGADLPTLQESSRSENVDVHGKILNLGNINPSWILVVSFPANQVSPGLFLKLGFEPRILHG